MWLPLSPTAGAVITSAEPCPSYDADSTLVTHHDLTIGSGCAGAAPGHEPKRVQCESVRTGDEHPSVLRPPALEYGPPRPARGAWCHARRLGRPARRQPHDSATLGTWRARP